MQQSSQGVEGGVVDEHEQTFTQETWVWLQSQICAEHLLLTVNVIFP